MHLCNFGEQTLQNWPGQLQDTDWRLQHKQTILAAKISYNPELNIFDEGNETLGSSVHRSHRFQNNPSKSCSRYQISRHCELAETQRPELLSRGDLAESFLPPQPQAKLSGYCKATEAVPNSGFKKSSQRTPRALPEAPLTNSPRRRIQSRLANSVVT